MHIKAQTIIPAGMKITKCAPSVGKGKSVWTLLRAEEKKLEKQAEMKNVANQLTQLLKNGFTVEEAVSLLKK